MLWTQPARSSAEEAHILERKKEVFNFGHIIASQKNNFEQQQQYVVRLRVWQSLAPCMEEYLYIYIYICAKPPVGLVVPLHDGAPGVRLAPLDQAARLRVDLEAELVG